MANETEYSPEYIGYRLEAFIGVFVPLTIILVSLRFYARSLSIGKYDASDWLVIAALIGQIVAGGIAIGSIKQAGVGHHVGYLLETNPEAVTTFFKYLVAMSTWYATTEGLAKLAICLLYKRLFPSRMALIVINITMIVLVCASIAGGLADLFGCTPFSAHWGTPEEQATYCIDTEALFVWGSFPNIVTDVILLILPLPIVWNLHASTGFKVGLVITFLFGSIGLITSIFRFIAFYNKNSFIDPTYSAVELIIWTVCEPGVYLIAACLVVYRPLLDKIGIPMIIRRRKSSSPPGDVVRQLAGHDSDKGFTLRSIGGGIIRRVYGDEMPLRKNSDNETLTTTVTTTNGDVV
ncbi:hypothetical protein F4774DRAFT_366040 [Daldinia eschscholtzii]|nr:hypothetical protein F4774DRAFT_366040 [Daldinia eschscholtzii]